MIQVKIGPVDNLMDVIRRSPVADVEDAGEILRRCMFESIEVRYGQVDGKVACVWGLIPPTLLSEAAYLWLITTEIVARHKFLFVRHSQRYIEEALKVYPIINGDVLTNNESTKRWLRWLGAEFLHPVGGRIPFTIRRKN